MTKIMREWIVREDVTPRVGDVNGKVGSFEEENMLILVMCVIKAYINDDSYKF